MQFESPRFSDEAQNQSSNDADKNSVFEHHETFDLKLALRYLWNSCIHYWKFFIICPLVCLLLIVTYIKVWPATYIAEVVLLAESPKDSGRASFYSHWNTFRNNDLGSEITLVGSNQVVEPVIDQFGLTYDQVYHPMMSHIVYLWGESWIGQKYRSVKYFFFPKKESPYSLSDEEIERAKTIKDFKAGVHLEPIPESLVGLLLVKGPSPEVAQVANSVADNFIEYRVIRLEEEAQQAVDSLQAATKEALAELELKELELRDFHLANDLLLSLEKDKVEVSQYLEAKFALEDSKASYLGLEAKKKMVESSYLSEPDEKVAGRQISKNPITTNIEAQISSIKTSLISESLRYQEGSPELTMLKMQLKLMEERLNSEDSEQETSRAIAANSTKETLKNSLNAITAELTSQKKIFEQKEHSFLELEERLRLLPNKMLGLNALERERAGLQKKHYVLNERLAMAETSLSTVRSAPGAFKIVDYASIPDKPIAPNNKLYLLASVLAGLAIAFALAVAFDLILQPMTIDRMNNNFPSSLRAIIHLKGDLKYSAIKPFSMLDKS